MSENPDELVAAATRALAILDVFSMEEPHLGLSDIARRVGLAKTTALRLLKTLEASHYVARTEQAQWRLGPATASLGSRYTMAFDVRESIEPALRKLSDETGEDMSFFVRDGDRRIRLVKVRCPQASHNRARVGEAMPLDRGASGLVLLAYMGEAGPLYDAIRARGYHVTVGEARQTSASIAVPVFGNRWRVAGALCIGMPVSSDVAPRLHAYAPRLMQAAQALSAMLSFDAGVARHGSRLQATWHP
ncbi:IclR family transcriptional regulator [Bordetella sp. N]|uniref:IclR family transcriptional regulator n=1 Tax=Bordetella sp. N TaxID=1746199 RepID=UPI00070F6A7D|nr:IclR family transcriptional regulator [Bordetella sp. N]ALM84523.1 hypothetical protein ASB57_17465 [Bordetella sp. N]